MNNKISFNLLIFKFHQFSHQFKNLEQNFKHFWPGVHTLHLVFVSLQLPVIQSDPPVRVSHGAGPAGLRGSESPSVGVHLVSPHD